MHAHGPGAPGHDDTPHAGPQVSHRALLVIVALIGIAGVVGMLLQSPTGRYDALTGDEPPPSRLVGAQIVEVVPLDLDDPTLLPGAVAVEVTARLDDSGELVRFEMTDDTGETFQPGQRVKVAEVRQVDGAPAYYISDFQRGRPLAVLAALFLVAVIGFGRLQGLRALAGLAFTLLLIAGYMVPAILDGRNPVAVALAGAAVIMIATLYLSHGFHPKTTAAAVGTGAALVLTGLLAWGFVAAANITGMTSEEARMATFEVGGLSLRGLLLAGIIIGGLGVLDDVTMSQASTVVALRRADPHAGFAEVFRNGISVGRDHIAATVNTLFLAYAGASLPLLLLFTTGRDSLANILTSEVVAVEIVRTLVGSVGLIAAVPLTTALAAALTRPAPPPRAGPGAPEQSPPEQGARRPGETAEAEDPEWERRLREAYGLRPRGDRPAH